MIKLRPALFKWRHFDPELIVCAVHWYLRFSFSYRDVEKLLIERGLPAFRSFDGAWRTIQGYEVLHMIRKGQVRWLPKGDVLGQIQFIRQMLRLKAE